MSCDSLAGGVLVTTRRERQQHVVGEKLTSRFPQLFELTAPADVRLPRDAYGTDPVFSMASSLYDGEQRAADFYPPAQQRSLFAPRPFVWDERVGAFPLYWEQTVSRGRALSNSEWSRTAVPPRQCESNAHDNGRAIQGGREGRAQRQGSIFRIVTL